MSSNTNIQPFDIQRGDHLFVWRKVKLYNHHGIAISSEDAQQISAQNISLLIPSDEPIIILEQNLMGLRMVTIEQFRLESYFGRNVPRKLNRAEYSVSKFQVVMVKRSGTCYHRARDAVDVIIQRAIETFNDERKRDLYAKYSRVFRNCEHFAYYCCTGIMNHSEQVELLVTGAKYVFNSVVHICFRTIYDEFIRK